MPRNRGEPLDGAAGSAASGAAERLRKRRAGPETRKLLLPLLLVAQRLGAAFGVAGGRVGLELLPVEEVVLLLLLTALERVELEPLARSEVAGAGALERLLQLQIERVGLLLARAQRLRHGVFPER